MKTVSPSGARELNLKFRIARRQTISFRFTENGTAYDISGMTWQLFIKKNPGDKKNVISLTLGNGLSIPVYEDNVIDAVFEAAQTEIQEGQYYWELLRTDLVETKLNGWATFGYGPQDAG